MTSSTSPDGPPPAEWLIWQLADSALPVGGFAHSGGLEAAWKHGEISGSDGLSEFLTASLHQMGHAALPFLGAVFDDPSAFQTINAFCDVFLSNHVANRASRAQGHAFLACALRCFPSEALAECHAQITGPAPEP